MTMLLTAFMAAAQEEPAVPAAAAGIGIVGMLIWLVVMVVLIASLWKVFTKAGEPGWAAIVPIYNIIVMLRIAGKPLWWFVLLLIPFVNFIAAILILIAFAKNFGKGAGFGIGLALLGFIFFPLLAFGDAKFSRQA